MTGKMTMNAEQAVALLRKVVFEKGADYVYPPEIRSKLGGCVNFYDEQPSCIVGWSLHEMGLSFEAARNIGVDGMKGASVTLFEVGEYMNFPWKFSRSAKAVFYTAQTLQDSGAPWGVALEWAERAAVDGLFYYADGEYGSDKFRVFPEGASRPPLD